MSTIAVNNITDEQGSGRPVFTNGVQTSNINGGQVGGRRNLIINGDMRVAQRGTSETGVTSGGFYTVDRFAFTRRLSNDLSVSLNQSNDSPEEFSNSFELIVDSPETSPERLSIQTRIEAQDLTHLNYGTENAKTTTLSFFVKSSETGKYYVNVRYHDAGQGYTTGYTINASNTWEKKVIIIPGNTSGAGIENDNGIGIWLRWQLGNDPDFVTSNIDVWGDRADHEYNGSDQVNLAEINGAVFKLTGVQLEVGDTATEFEHRSISEELALCQRYYYQLGPNMQRFGVLGEAIASTVAQFNYVLPVKMRSSPSLLTDSNTSDYELYRGNQNENATNISFSSFLNPDGDCWGCRVNLSVDSGFISAGQVTQGLGRNNAFFGFDAEL